MNHRAHAFLSDDDRRSGQAGSCRMRCRLPPLSGTTIRVTSVGRPLTTGPSRQPVNRSASGRSRSASAIAGVLCAASVLVGCATATRSSDARGPAHAAHALGSDAVALGWYSAGKRSLEQGNMQAALVQFEQAAAAMPQLADAHNGRVVALARLGLVDAAVATARSVLASGVSSAELTSNLALLETRLHGSAGSTEAPSREAAAAAVSIRATKTETSVLAAAPADPSGLTWIQHGSNVLELREPAIAKGPIEVQGDTPRAEARPQSGDVLHRSMPSAVAGSTRKDVRLEISNGVGRANLARSTAQALKAMPGVTVVRISNHAHFRQQRTEVHFRSADEVATARMLVDRLALQATFVENAALRRDVGVKVVLGVDSFRRGVAPPPVQDAALVAIASKP
jgi:hypothetical protein